MTAGCRVIETRCQRLGGGYRVAVRGNRPNNRQKLESPRPLLLDILSVLAAQRIGGLFRAVTRTRHPSYEL